jgi:thiol:disulfide interchange protein
MKPLSLVILALAVAAPVQAQDSRKSPFVKIGLDQALARAKRDKKVVLVDFSADWCVYCKKMDQTTFSDARVKRLLTSKSVPIKIDVDAHHDLAKKYNVTGIPCVVVFAGKGTFRVRQA